MKLSCRAFLEIHAGFREKSSEGITVHIDGGLIATDLKPVDEYRGGSKLLGYINVGMDFVEVFGHGFGVG